MKQNCKWHVRKGEGFSFHLPLVLDMFPCGQERPGPGTASIRLDEPLHDGALLSLQGLRTWLGPFFGR